MFCGRRRPITTGRPAGAVREAEIDTFVAAFATGAVTFAKYPPPNGPSVSELEAVVLVVKTPLAPEPCAGVGVAVGNTTVFPLHAHSAAASAYAPKAARTNAERIENGRMPLP